ncbi:unnamed protein product [Ascophyllum nodosum]
MQQNHHQPVQGIDFSAFADSWNQDVVAAEQDVLARLQDRVLDGDLIYRKTGGHLQNYWTQSRNDVDIKRTVEPQNAVILTLRQRLMAQSAREKLRRRMAARDPPVLGGYDPK